MEAWQEASTFMVRYPGSLLIRLSLRPSAQILLKFPPYEFQITLNWSQAPPCVFSSGLLTMHIKDTVQGAPSSMANDVVALWTMVSRSEYVVCRDVLHSVGHIQFKMTNQLQLEVYISKYTNSS